MVTSEGRRSLRFGTDGLWDLLLVLQKEIHDLFTVTFGNSWAIGMCAYAYIIYFISFNNKVCNFSAKYNYGERNNQFEPRQ